MPKLTRWAIRLALLHLVLGFTLGGLLLFHKGISLHPALWSTLPGHIETLLLGWTGQLILGMAFWILPRFSSSPRRGNIPAAWLSVLLLNAGVVLVGLGPFGSGFPWALAGRLAEVGAAISFGVHAWPRVKPPGAP